MTFTEPGPMGVWPPSQSSRPTLAHAELVPGAAPLVQKSTKDERCRGTAPLNEMRGAALGTRSLDSAKTERCRCWQPRTPNLTLGGPSQSPLRCEDRTEIPARITPGPGNAGRQLAAGRPSEAPTRHSSTGSNPHTFHRWFSLTMCASQASPTAPRGEGANRPRGRGWQCRRTARPPR